MKEIQPKYAQYIIFETIKLSSPFKSYQKSQTRLSSSSKNGKGNLSKNYNQDKQFLPLQSKISSQKRKKVTFVNQNDSNFSKINPQQTLKEQKRRLKVLEQKYKKQKQTLKVNKSIQQVKRNVDELIGSINLNTSKNLKDLAKYSKFTVENNFFKDKDNKSTLMNFGDFNINNQNKDQFSTSRLKVYRHIEDTKKQPSKFIENESICLQDKFKTQRGMKRSFSVKQSKTNELKKSYNKQDSKIQKRDDNIFIPMRIRSQRNIRTKNQSTIISNPQRGIKNNSQVLNKQSQKLSKQLNKIKKQVKSIRNMLNSTNQSLREINQLSKSNSTSIHKNSLKNEDRKSKWIHENEIELLRHKLLGK